VEALSDIRFHPALIREECTLYVVNWRWSDDNDDNWDKLCVWMVPGTFYDLEEEMKD
jgi:hypothetical protein